MLEISFETGGVEIYWVVCQRLRYKSLEGYVLIGVQEDSRGSSPCRGLQTPPGWNVLEVKEVYGQ